MSVCAVSISNMLLLLIVSLLSLLGQPVMPEEPGEESYRYDVRYLYGKLDTKVAQAIFTMTPDQWEEKDVYKADINIVVQPIFRLFMSAKYLVKCYFTRPGMGPLYYYSPNSKGDTWCTYEEGEEGIRFYKLYDDMTEPQVFIFPNDGRTMDLASMLYYFRGYDFEERKPYDMTMVMAAKLVPATITMEGIDTEKFPGHNAQKIHIVMPERGLMENGSGNEIFLWIDADGTRPVLGLQVALGKHSTLVCKIVENKL